MIQKMLIQMNTRNKATINQKNKCKINKSDGPRCYQNGKEATQITGNASSDSRRYALNGLYIIDDTKDDDTDEYTKQTNNQPKKQMQEKQVGRATLLSK